MTRLSVNPIALLFVLALGSAAFAAPLEEGGSGRVVEVVDGDTLVLDDGRQVRLVGIQAPKLPLGRPGFEAWPLGEKSKAALEALVLGRVVSLRHGGRRIDRHGRALAHLFDEDGIWIQGALLDKGMARVYSFADNRALVPVMLAHERAAQASGRGIWGNPFYAVRAPGETERFIGSFQIVGGLVLDAAVVKRRGYLNFGPDWRTDFTVSIGPRDRAAFTESGIDIEAYAGQRVRVRGWIKSFNGPMIEATHPEQIEVLSE